MKRSFEDALGAPLSSHAKNEFPTPKEKVNFFELLPPEIIEMIVFEANAGSKPFLFLAPLSASSKALHNELQKYIYLWRFPL